MADPRSPQESREEATAAARHLVLNAVIDIVRQTGGKVIRRPILQSLPDSGTMYDVEAAAGLSAARQVELAARKSACDYIRASREAGQTWHEIGAELGLGPIARHSYLPLAEVAFDYAAGDSAWEYACSYGRTFLWTCPACHEVISDRGTSKGPADDERGHITGCERPAVWHAMSPDQG